MCMYVFSESEAKKQHKRPGGGALSFAMEDEEDEEDEGLSSV